MVRSRPRPVAVNRVSQENAGAHESKEGGDCFQHLTHPATQRLSEDANRIAQSKGFWRRGGLAVVLMISGNTVAGSHCLYVFCRRGFKLRSRSSHRAMAFAASRAGRSCMNGRNRTARRADGTVLAEMGHRRLKQATSRKKARHDGRAITGY